MLYKHIQLNLHLTRLQNRGTVLITSYLKRNKKSIFMVLERTLTDQDDVLFCQDYKPTYIKNKTFLKLPLNL